MGEYITRASQPASELPCDVTPEMVAAGEAVLWQLAGEVTKGALAKEVYLAMAACDRQRGVQGIAKVAS